MVSHKQIYGGETHALRAERHIYLTGHTQSQDDARPPSTARRNASPADCGTESLAKVPAFIEANTFAGFVSFWAGPADDCCGAMPLTNDGCPKPGLNPVGSVNMKSVQRNAKVR